MKKVILIIVLITIASSIFFVMNKNAGNKLIIKTDKKEVTFNVEFVRSPGDKARGLAKYDDIDDGFGMVFFNDVDTKTPFWMKDMKFPIDILFINSNNIIVDIHENNQPCLNNDSCPLIIPISNYRTVLEIKNGLVNKYEIKVGDQIVFKTTF